MRALISPGIAQGKVLAPPSKSMAHRMLIGAGLAEGMSVVRNVELSEDIKATLGILKAIGCEYSLLDGDVCVKGIGGKQIEASCILDAKESGSTLRFFIPMLLAGGNKCLFTGAKSLFSRPLGVYEDICKEQQISFLKTENTLELEGKLKATHYRIPGNISSQFVTGLLYALPLLDGESVLEILPPIESQAYIEMTLAALSTFGIVIEKRQHQYYILGNQTYHARSVDVEGDYSNAAFLDAFNLLGGHVEIQGLKEDSLQGDQIYATYFQQLEEEQPKMDISECPDLGPILMGMAALKRGAIFTGTSRLKMKESDRGTAMAEELKKFGIQVDVGENHIVVHKGEIRKPIVALNSHNDHRIAMTMAVLCSVAGGVIEDCMAVRKSFPNYYEVICKLGIPVELED